MEDEQILDLFFAREEAAVLETQAKYGAALLRLAKNLLGSEADAQECLNDAYLAAWNRIPPARPERLYGWLCRVLRNLCCDRLDYNRAAKRSANVVSLSGELEQVLTVPEPEREDGLAQAIDSFLRGLDGVNRRLFVRRYFYADSLADIARLTGMGENSIAARLLRLRRKLRSYLIEEGFTL